MPGYANVVMTAKYFEGVTVFALALKYAGRSGAGPREAKDDTSTLTDTLLAGSRGDGAMALRLRHLYAGRIAAPPTASSRGAAHSPG